MLNFDSYNLTSVATLALTLESSSRERDGGGAENRDSPTQQLSKGLGLGHPYCIHRNFSDLTIIATKLKTLFMLNTIYSRPLFLAFIKGKLLKILNAIIQNTAIFEENAIVLEC